MRPDNLGTTDRLNMFKKEFNISGGQDKPDAPSICNNKNNL